MSLTGRECLGMQIDDDKVKNFCFSYCRFIQHLKKRKFSSLVFHIVFYVTIFF